MRVVIAAAVVGLVMLAGTAHAAESKGSAEFRAYGPGVESCGAWMQETGGGLFTMSWVLGYVSGVGAATSYNLARTDSAGIEEAARAYCVKHPLSSVETAAHAVAQTLIDPSQ